MSEEIQSWPAQILARNLVAQNFALSAKICGFYLASSVRAGQSRGFPGTRTKRIRILLCSNKKTGVNLLHAGSSACVFVVLRL